jgi:hypothetical protein
VVFWSCLWCGDMKAELMTELVVTVMVVAIGRLRVR